MDSSLGGALEILLRWMHVFAGVTWIGVLYYFNFIQTPFFGSELGGTAKSAMTRGLVPNALWWFRWGAMFTFLSGWCIAAYRAMGMEIELDSAYMTAILTGGVMGTLMWYNVWFVIWPAQQVVIANAEQVAGGGEPIPEAAARGGKAGMASRTNTLFSIPMLFFMITAGNLGTMGFPFLSAGNTTVYWLVAGALILAVEVNGLAGNATTQKPLTSVSGTIHFGLALWAALFAVGWLLNS